ncbi:uncharacterized protein LOC113857687 isoform X2 [Abrus precatorius]|uniref:Uncharacterized protein LOC113857687 isoform X2 n=1 Tax=Abrus precatorius TaxID=3816 RepID=A0A8B8KP40_ABRPR|nr:uncharacterized protein LOC113857687 isoform X2 [Abrus precatorius]
MATTGWTPGYTLKLKFDGRQSHKLNANSSVHYRRRFGFATRICCTSKNYNDNNQRRSQSEAIQVYTQIERLLTDSVRQSQDAWWGSTDWNEVEGAWILKPKSSEPNFVVHFIGGIFVGAAPQLTYRWFLERLSEKGVLVIATPYASGFDHFLIADEVQFKFDRCYRTLQETIQELPIFGVGHSLGSVIHLLIGSRYAVQRSGSVLMAFNNKEASSAVPLFSPVLVPMAQTIGPLLSDIFSSPTLRAGAEMTLKQLENVSPPILKQIKSYYGISRNLLIKFNDDLIDETSTLAQVLSSESAISSVLDMSIRKLPGDHGLPLQQALPDVPPAMADAVNRGSELLSNLTIGTPWETVAKEVGNTLGMDSRVLRAQVSKEMDHLVDVIASWIASNAGPKLLRP